MTAVVIIPSFYAMSETATSQTIEFQGRIQDFLGGKPKTGG